MGSVHRLVGDKTGQEQLMRECRMQMAIGAVLTVVCCCSSASAAFADEVLYCTDADVIGFKWDRQDDASRVDFHLDRFTVRVGPAQGPAMNERLVVKMSDGDDRGVTQYYKCLQDRNTPDHVSCDSPSGGERWMFSGANYVRTFLAGGPPGSGRDPNIAIAYGTCTRL
jgi:hypothetical protein